MGRQVRKADADDTLVKDYEVAPHRYIVNGFDDSYRYADNARDYVAGIPYKRGDVIYVEHNGKAKKALVHNIVFDRDRYGDRRDCYNVQLETLKGRWAKLWVRKWPGHIQRGYHLAGLAPDMEGA